MKRECEKYAPSTMFMCPCMSFARTLIVWSPGELGVLVWKLRVLLLTTSTQLPHQCQVRFWILLFKVQSGVASPDTNVDDVVNKGSHPAHLVPAQVQIYMFTFTDYYNSRQHHELSIGNLTI